MATYFNRTRVSSSIPRRLLREGKWALLPIYSLLRTSDLAREGIESSGSWRFADHIYRRRPSGRFLVGSALDAVLLALPSARSFRLRYLFVRREVERRVPALVAEKGRPISIVSVPCGIPRDLGEAAATLRNRGDLAGDTVRFIGLDLDPEALAAARRLLHELGVAGAFELVEADAFDGPRWPGPVDIVSSTGFGEFLEGDELARFLKLCHEALVPGGVLLTTAMAQHRLSDYLLRELGEIQTQYRSSDELAGMLRGAGFSRVRTATDRRGLQTFAVAEKADR